MSLHWGGKLMVGAMVATIALGTAFDADAKRMGAHDFKVLASDESFKPLSRKFDLILNTVSANIPVQSYLDLVKVDGTLVMIGLPTDPISVGAGTLIGSRRSLAGSMIGGIGELQEMLDFCAQHNITSDVELIRADEINEAYERAIKGEVKYRFVIDTATL